MSTFMANPQTVVRKWYIIDAEGRPLGRVAAAAAALLRGKHKVDFTTHVDCGDHVIILNCEKIVLTGKKLDQKMYRHHSGWVGGLKEVKYGTLIKTKPEFIMELAVKGMLPSNTIGRNSMKRLRVYVGSEHEQQAQMPEIYNID